MDTSEIKEHLRVIIADFKNGYFGYESTIKRIMKLMAEIEHEAYQEGYEDGYRHGEEDGYEDAIHEVTDEYFRGYEEALKCVENNIKYNSSIPSNIKEKIYEILDYVGNKK